MEEAMKKRLISLLLILTLCITMLPSANVFAAGQNNTQTAAETESYATVQTYSNWAMQDLILGDTYGCYPLSWYEKDMTAPITQGKLRVLMAGLRLKMLNTNGVASSKYQTYRLTQKLTVDKVLSAFYTLVSAYTFTPDLALKDVNYIKFMKENGVYTGKNGEQALTDVCSIEQACIMATRLVTTIYNKLNAGSKGFFWEAKANGNTVYMLGSIHMATNDIYPLNDKILEAYESSDALAVEVNLFDQAGAVELANIAVYTDGTTLKDHVSKETYDKVIAIATTFGYPEQQISMLKPWYIYSMFNALAVTDSGSATEANEGARLGIDLNFTMNALFNGKPVLEVEGYAVQANMLDSFSDKLEEYLLNGTIDEVNKVVAGSSDEGSDDLNEMLNLWREGDADSFKKYASFEYEYQDILADETTVEEKNLLKELQDKIFTQRDKKMAEYIDGLLKAEGGYTYFVIVGSGHYVSDYSVLDILKEKGYEINQIK